MTTTLVPELTVPPANVARCVKCDGPIRYIEREPYECADCGRNVYVHDDLHPVGFHWEITDGWLTIVETIDEEEGY